ncbi:MAG: hypothetical protein ACHP7C_01875 [Lysobacterales bacterium]|jgi:hypothetical protein
MMLPKTSPSESPIKPPAPSAMPFATTTTTPGEVGNGGLTHADYNLQPLLVKSLGHYVTSAGEDERERFHIR